MKNIAPNSQKHPKTPFWKEVIFACILGFYSLWLSLSWAIVICIVLGGELTDPKAFPYYISAFLSALFRGVFPTLIRWRDRDIR